MLLPLTSTWSEHALNELAWSEHVWSEHDEPSSHAGATSSTCPRVHCAGCQRWCNKSIGLKALFPTDSMISLMRVHSSNFARACAQPILTAPFLSPWLPLSLSPVTQQSAVCPAQVLHSCQPVGEEGTRHPSHLPQARPSPCQPAPSRPPGAGRGPAGGAGQ